MKGPMIFLALFIMGAGLLCASTVSCVPGKVPTSEKGRTGLPTAKYEKGTPPGKWDVDPDTLPVYPGAKTYGKLGSYITPDSLGKVISYYENKLSNAEVTTGTGSNAIAVFKTSEFTLKVMAGEGDNTLILFSAPEE